MTEAWLIKEKAPELALFAAITAQEEASSAIIVSLQEKSYPGAERLDRHRHLHKVVVQRCLEAVLPTLTLPANEGYIFGIELDLGVRDYPLRLRIGTPDGKYMYPIPPLEATLSINGQIYDFAEEFKQFASEKNASDMRAYVKRRENERNRILYASDKGIPSTTISPDKILPVSQDNVLRLLVACLFVDLYPRQSFVQQFLDAILGMLVKTQPQQAASNPEGK